MKVKILEEKKWEINILNKDIEVLHATMARQKGEKKSASPNDQ